MLQTTGVGIGVGEDEDAWQGQYSSQIEKLKSAPGGVLGSMSNSNVPVMAPEKENQVLPPSPARQEHDTSSAKPLPPVLPTCKGGNMAAFRRSNELQQSFPG
ncbi:MAG: hypothetical protein IPM82_26075 [Saprospiraceae bacterium]|nr:hypothetical protein [Saprospiraceae bacterium]